MKPEVGSLFSGIGGFDLGLERVGFEIAWQVECDKNCNQVLAKHWTECKRYERVEDVGKHNLITVDLVCGGFPCQDLSVAGKRAGLSGERSGLWFEFARIIDELAPAWVLIENVPGLLSSDGGNDFRIIIQWLAERGYGVAWRVLDSQHFGLAQRRKRVFIVGSLGSGRAAQVLFESACVCGDSPKGGETWEGSSRSLAPSLNASGAGVERSGETKGQDPIVVSMALNAKGGSGRMDGESETFVCDGGTVHNCQFAIYNIQSNDGGTHTRKDRPQGGLYVRESDKSLTIGSTDMTTIVQSMLVRRLTPTECERLQGFPDGWTTGLSDSARYRMLGNAVSVPVIEWIGKRILDA